MQPEICEYQIKDGGSMQAIRMTLAKFRFRDSHMKIGLLCMGLPFLILIGLLVYQKSFLTESQVRNAFIDALTQKDYESAFQYVDSREEGISLSTFKQWVTSTPDVSSLITLKKVPASIPLFHVWKVHVPTQYIQLELPFAKTPVTIDGIPYTSNDKNLKVPLLVGTHVLHLQIPGISEPSQTLRVELDDSTNAHAMQNQKITIQPSAKLKASVEAFLTEYNQTWCEAVNSRNAKRILPYLTGKNSSEYQFITKYIQSLNKENWLRDTETLTHLETTQLLYVDPSHVKVHTTEMYHHDTSILQDHDKWAKGAHNEYDDTVKWIYDVKLLDDHTFQIESLQHPAEG
jgi:hypothetical protein